MLMEIYTDLLTAIFDIVTVITILLKKDKMEPGSDDTPDRNEDGGGPGPGPGGDDSEPEDNDSKNKKLDKIESGSNDTPYRNEDGVVPGPGPGPGPGGDGSEPEDNDSDKNKKLDKGKGKAKATTPELIPEEKQESDKDEEDFQRDLEEAKLNSLRPQEGNGESSKQGAQSGMEEQAMKEDVKYQYNKAVEEFNDNQSQLVDNDVIDPGYKQFLIERSQKLRETVDHYKKLKDELGAESSEEEYSSDYSEDSEDNRSSKRPRNR